MNERANIVRILRVIYGLAMSAKKGNSKNVIT